MRLTEFQLMAIQAKQGTLMTTPSAPRRTPKHIEDDHQRTLISWADYTRLDPLKHPVLPGSVLGDYLFAIPNGGKRFENEAKRLKGLGVRAGIPDLMLALLVDHWPGLFIEMKRPRMRGEAAPRISDSQMDKLQRFAKAGYCCRVAYGCDHAQKIITDYLAGKLTEPLIID